MGKKKRNLKAEDRRQQGSREKLKRIKGWRHPFSPEDLRQSRRGSKQRRRLVAKIRTIINLLIIPLIIIGYHYLGKKLLYAIGGAWIYMIVYNYFYLLYLDFRYRLEEPDISEIAEEEKWSLYQRMHYLWLCTSFHLFCQTWGVLSTYLSRTIVSFIFTKEWTMMDRFRLFCPFFEKGFFWWSTCAVFYLALRLLS